MCKAVVGIKGDWCTWTFQSDPEKRTRAIAYESMRHPMGSWSACLSFVNTNFNARWSKP